MKPTVSWRSLSAPLAFGSVFAAALLSGPLAGAAPSTEAVDAIDQHYALFGGEMSLLGAPVAEAGDVPGGAVRDYQGGSIYYSPATGARVVYGAILQRYRELGGPAGELGFPENDESDVGDGTGRFNDFSAPGGAAIYWSPERGPSVVAGRILDAWRQSGGPAGPFGYPTADTVEVDGVQTGRFAGPGGTEIQWSPAGGLLTVPPELAAGIPGFEPATRPSADGTTTVSAPPPDSPDSSVTPAGSAPWWWIPAGIAAVAVLAGLVLLLRRRRAEPPPAAATTPAPAVTPPAAMPPPARPPAPPPSAKPPAPPPRPTAPPPPAKPAAPAAPPHPSATAAPGAAVPSSPPPVAKKVSTPAAPVAVSKLAEVRPDRPQPQKSTIGAESTNQDAKPVITYESTPAPDTGIQVTYENNAIGENQQSAADKSSRP